MKKFVAALAALALSVPSPSVATDTGLNTSAVVRIECEKATGTAFHVGKGVYVTAAHVVEDCVDIIPLVAYSAPESLDYAVFLGPVIEDKFEVKCDGFEPKKEYLAIGYGFGFEEPMYQPWIASSFSQDGYRSFIGEAIPGMSGGPVLDKEGKVHGIVNMRWPARSQELRDTVLCED
jgi:S1-C subfamily serine protease